jgi:hypothetical protein
MKNILFLLSLLLVTISYSQTAESLALEVELIQTGANSMRVEIVGGNDSDGSHFWLVRKRKDEASFPGSGPVFTAMTYNYNDITPGETYDFQVSRVTFDGNNITNVHSFTYVSGGISSENAFNKGSVLLVVDNTIESAISSEVTTLTNDLTAEGWNVLSTSVSRTASVSSVKAEIVNTYNTNSDLKSVILIGHVPVPYSGEINPDGHPDHLGAWPADTYYADMDGNWTDVSVNNTDATDSRNHNIPADNKFDQSDLPSSTELELGRIDFANLNNFSESETELLQAYLQRNHDFRTTIYVPPFTAMFDQGSFEGDPGFFFAQNAMNNFTPIVGAANVTETDFYTELTSQDHLLAYGCGAGSHTTCQGLNAGANLTSSQIANADLQSTFTFVFGSYFGDWDRQNNLLRSVLASGNTLATAWVGRPNYEMGNLALGETMGYVSKLSQNSGFVNPNLLIFPKDMFMQLY